MSHTFTITNEVINALDSLETAASFLDRTDEFRWKWLAISMHHALYSFCIAALHNSSPDDVTTNVSNPDNGYRIKKESYSHWKISRTEKIDSGPAYRISWEDTDDAPAPRSRRARPPKLIGFWTALARVQDPEFWMGRLYGTKALNLSDVQMRELQYLALQLRNDFVHFQPKGYIIDIDSIQQVCTTALRAIDFLVSESYSVHFLRKEWQDRAQLALNTLRDNL